MTGARFTIRQKVFKIFGDSFHIYDAAGGLAGYCKQKFLRLREDIRLYRDESKSQELFSMKARSIMDFSTTYDIAEPDGSVLGSIRRKGMSSLVRDSWLVFGPEGQQIAHLSEDSTGMAIGRRLIPLFATIFPQRFDMTDESGRPVATFTTHFNLFVYKLDVQIADDPPPIDLYVILAMGLLIAAIEGRQGDGDSGTGLFSGG